MTSLDELEKNFELIFLAEVLLQNVHVNDWSNICYPILKQANSNSKTRLDDEEFSEFYRQILEKTPLTKKNSDFTDKPDKIDIETLKNESSVKLQELLETNFPESRFIVDQLFESGTINMISAPPNKWKSWLVILCAISVASGRPFLGKFETEKQSVLIVNEEDTARLLQERCNMLMDKVEPLDIYFHIGKQIKLEEEFVDNLIEEMEEKKIGLVIFDSLRSVHNADENSSKEMQEVMDQIKRITRKGITVLFTHHNRKKNKFVKGKDESGEDSRGSSAINAAIHGHISCDEEDKDDGKYLVIYQPKLKAKEKLKPFRIQIENDKENKKMKFKYCGDYQSEENELNKATELLTSIFDKEPNGLTIKEINQMGVGSETTVRNAIRMLEVRGRIHSKTRKEAKDLGLPVRSISGKHNQKFYFSIKSDLYPIEEENLGLDNL